MNTRSVLLWHNNGAQRIYFTVNPAQIAVSRPNCNRVVPLALGGTVNLWGGRGLREVTISTFLPCAASPFFDGTAPAEVLALLRSWQDSGDPVRLIISGSDINDAFLIEDVTELLAEGDGDVGLQLTLREYKFRSALAKLAGGSGEKDTTLAGMTRREDERTVPDSYTVKKGDSLWAIALTLYGDGTRWREIADKNAVSDPRKLPVGKVLRL